MHAFLIAGNNKDKVSDLVKKLTENLNGKQLLEFSIDKIEDTRKLGNFLKLSQSPGTIIIIRDIENATNESSNAFLKNLEEPGVNISFILTASSEYKVLPTILSRCQLIKIPGGNKPVSDSDTEKFLNMKKASQLLFIDSIKSREDAKEFLQNTIKYLHGKLYSENPGYAKTGRNLRISQDALDAINKNGNINLQLTNFVIKLD